MEESKRNRPDKPISGSITQKPSVLDDVGRSGSGPNRGIDTHQPPKSELEVRKKPVLDTQKHVRRKNLQFSTGQNQWAVGVQTLGIKVVCGVIALEKQLDDMFGQYPNAR